MSIEAQIARALKNSAADTDFEAIANDILKVLNYKSARVPAHTRDTASQFVKTHKPLPPRKPNTKSELRFVEAAQNVAIIFQITETEIKSSADKRSPVAAEFKIKEENSFLFVAVELKQGNYNRSKYADFTREINKRFAMPVLVLFISDTNAAERCVSIGFVARRQSEIDEDRDVLEKVSLIRDISLADPQRGHLDILAQLELNNRLSYMETTKKEYNFEGLRTAILHELDAEALNKRFYRDLFKWFDCALNDEDVKLPTEAHQTRADHLIRLITRLLFVWFLKEKGLVAPDLFIKEQAEDLVKEDDFDDGDAYYRVILQNLFFATLNTPIDTRGFSEKNNQPNSEFAAYRYKDQMRDSDKLEKLFNKTPFVNGGLFDCLDNLEEKADDGCIDCFSDDENHYGKLSIPNRLFFDKGEDAQRGLLSLFERYKFTVEESTPIEQEVALDPELLGRVFEHLLAANNPETKESARKKTGSYYTPRPIVDYIVTQALIASLANKCAPADGDGARWRKDLGCLLDHADDFDDAEELFVDSEKEALVETIGKLKILDPAVGSGAFPMSILHRLTLALRRLDPQNHLWQKFQKDIAGKRFDEALEITDEKERKPELNEIDDTFQRYRDSDFGRKLYIIQNSVFGVDIQPIACQITKLRFFISLAIEQDVDAEDADNNYDFRPLPNLETRLIAADTLIGLSQNPTLPGGREDVQMLEVKLSRNRERYFHAATRKLKQQHREKDESLRDKLTQKLKQYNTMLRDNADKIAEWDLYDQTKSADWFDPKWMFGIEQGFDVVIGNPPYVQLQKNKGKLRKLYENSGFKTFERKGNIYQLFYEKGHALLADGGHLGYITSRTWMRAPYGEKMRAFFANSTQPLILLDLGAGVFDATVDTNILLFAERPNGARWLRAGVAANDEQRANPDNIQDFDLPMPPPGDSWHALNQAERDLRQKFEKIGTPLKKWDVHIKMGVKTGRTKIFIIDEATRKEILKCAAARGNAEHQRTKDMIKPVLVGEDIKRYRAQWTNKYLIATHNGYGGIPHIDIEHYPSVKAHLDKFYPELKKRQDQGKTPYNLRSYKFYADLEREKLIYSETAGSAKFYYDNGRYFINKTCFMMTGEHLKILMGLLSSKLLEFAFKKFSDGAMIGNDGCQYNEHAIEKFPVLRPDTSNEHAFQEIERLVNKILAAKAKLRPVDAPAPTLAEMDALKEEIVQLETAIDELVYDLYELTRAERQRIETAIAATRARQRKRYMEKIESELKKIRAAKAKLSSAGASAKAETLKQTIAKAEAEIDELVCDIYNLTDAERQLIATAKS